MSKVTVSVPQGKTSVLLVNEKNPEQAAIMLRSNVMAANDQGFLQIEKRVGWFKGKTSDLEAIAKTLKDGDDFYAKTGISVKLVVREKTEPFYPTQEPKKNPTTGEIVTHKGAAIYRSTFVVDANSPAQDEKLTNDVVAVNADTKMTANTGFDTIK